MLQIPQLSPFLSLQVLKIERELEEWKATIETYGYSLSTDGWDDCAERHLYNYVVMTNKGPYFLDSIDVTAAAVEMSRDDTLKAVFIAEKLIKRIEQLGPDDAVSVVTDGPNVMRAAWKIVEKKFPKIVCTWCAGHVTDLMLEDLGKLPFVKTSIDDARSVVKFIRGHFHTKTELRKLTKSVLLLPAETRFATSFIMLERLHSLKDELQEITSSKKYKEWLKGKKYADEGKRVAKVVADDSWWLQVESLLDISGPVVNVLKMADSNIPQAGKIYYEMSQLGERLTHLLLQEEEKGVLKKRDLEEVNYGYSRRTQPKYLFRSSRSSNFLCSKLIIWYEISCSNRLLNWWGPRCVGINIFFITCRVVHACFDF